MTTLISQSEVRWGRSRRVAATHFLIAMLGIWYAATLGWRLYRHVTQHSLTSFSYPTDAALLIVHGDMLLWQGQQNAVPTARLLPPLAGWFVDLLPRDDEEILRGTIAYIETERGDARDAGRLRASLAVILAETGARARAFQELDILAKDSRFSPFARAARAIYSERPPEPDLSTRRHK